LINGEVYDHFAPSTDNVRRIWERVEEKVKKGQALNIVIGLQDSGADEEALRRQFADWPIRGLGKVLIVRPDGTIGGL
jgi:filamentous hemagglutinin